MNEVEIAWAAGLFEGEGSATCYKGNKGQKRLYLRLFLDMTDRDVVEKFWRIVDLGSFVGPMGPYGKELKENRKPKWRWYATGNVARSLVENTGFFSHLCSRRQLRIKEILAEIDAQAPLIKRNSQLTHCKNGHPWNEENTLHQKGHRQCRACQRDRYHKFVQKHGKEYVRTRSHDAYMRRKLAKL